MNNISNKIKNIEKTPKIFIILSVLYYLWMLEEKQFLYFNLLEL